ncbi:MAG TPA: cysteine--tRNA ligase [Geminicoccaceae bacterium]|nr:cysteine--tRNA ligase [Geminicoccaceae bacterium]
MQLFNSLTGRKETFTPADPRRPTMYVCGPTVYNHPHIGNARPAVVFDVLFRLLRYRYGDALYVRNITDIDDKIIAAAAEEGVPTEVIAQRYAAAYDEDMAALNVLPPTVAPRATCHVPEMIAMIERLIERGHAYEANGHVLFHVPSFPNYGALSRRSREEMIEGARVEVAPYKRDPADFVLWKPSRPDQPGWDSPWGRGRPGWHIECSAMVRAHLGVTIDIHGGGLDLKFPHHENEIAQSVCAHDGAPLARFWLHNGFLDVEREKMSKSLGNVVLVRDLLAEAPGEAIRYALLSAHYRKPLDWSSAGLARAKHALDRLYLTLSELPGPNEPGPDATMPEALLAALEDDLNTPRAFAELFALARAANASDDEAERRALKEQMLAGGGLLGLLQQDPETWLKTTGKAEIDEAEIERLIELRAAARKAKNFEEADRIRDQLAAEGVILEDQPGKTRWRLAG